MMEKNMKRIVMAISCVVVFGVGALVVDCGGGKIPWDPSVLMDTAPTDTGEITEVAAAPDVPWDDVSPPPQCLTDDDCTEWAKSEFDECWLIFCNQETGYCDADPHALDGQPCNDESVCTLDDQCMGGQCDSEQLLDCGDGVDCTVESCHPLNGCTSNPDDDLCDDGLDCTVDNCDAALGCENVPDHTKCDDDLFCNGVEICSAEEGCVAGTAPGSDGIDCTVDECVEASQEITHTPDDAACDDGDPCTGTEICDSIQGCMVGEPPPEIDSTCDGVDDDCDGDTDDDYVSLDDCGVGACLMNNTPSICVEGVETACIPGEAAANDATCDGVDDDCDSVADEDFAPVTECGVGACQDSSTPSTCVEGIETPCAPGEPAATDDTCDYVDDDCDGETDEDADPPCDYTPVVTGADLYFLATLGLPTDIVVDNDDGTYDSHVVDLSNPNLSGGLTAHVNDNSSLTYSYSVSAGVPNNIELVLSRDTVCADDSLLRAYAYVTDSLGSPVTDDTVVTFTLEIDGQTVIGNGIHQDGGLFSAWLTTPGVVFADGAVGTVVAVAGDVTSAAADVTATGLPTALALATGEAGVELPLCARFDGTTFDVPVYVNTGANTLGSYNITLLFDEIVLQVTGVSKGGASDMAPPVSNADTTANTLGSLSFNAVNTNPGDGIDSGTKIEMAVVHFQVISDVPAGTIAAISGDVLELNNTIGAGISFLSNPVLQIQDGDGQGDEGVFEAKDVKVEGIFARMDDNTLMDFSAMDDSVASTGLAVLAVFGDGAFADIRDDANTLCQSGDEAVVVATACEIIAAGGGDTFVTALAAGFEADAPVWVLAPELPLEVSALDSILSTITDLGVVQETRPEVKATLTDGSFLSFTLDVTTKLSYAGSDAGVFTVDSGTGHVTPVANGAAMLQATGPGGEVLGEVEVTVDDTSVVTATGIHVVIPANITITQFDPDPVPDTTAFAAIQARVLALFTAEEQTVKSTALLVLSDDAETDGGSRIDITDDDNTSFESNNGNIGTVDEDGNVTAVGGGQADLDVTLGDGQGGEIASGTGP